MNTSAARFRSLALARPEVGSSVEARFCESLRQQLATPLAKALIHTVS